MTSAIAMQKTQTAEGRQPFSRSGRLEATVSTNKEDRSLSHCPRARGYACDGSEVRVIAVVSQFFLPLHCLYLSQVDRYLVPALLTKRATHTKRQTHQPTDPLTIRFFDSPTATGVNQSHHESLGVHRWPSPGASTFEPPRQARGALCTR